MPSRRRPRRQSRLRPHGKLPQPTLESSLRRAQKSTPPPLPTPKIDREEPDPLAGARRATRAEEANKRHQRRPPPAASRPTAARRRPPRGHRAPASRRSARPPRGRRARRRRSKARSRPSARPTRRRRRRRRPRRSRLLILNNLGRRLCLERLGRRYREDGDELPLSKSSRRTRPRMRRATRPTMMAS